MLGEGQKFPHKSIFRQHLETSFQIFHPHRTVYCYVYSNQCLTMSLKLVNHRGRVVFYFSKIGCFSIALSSYLIGEIISRAER